MAIRDAFKITRKTFFNPAGWLGYEQLKFYNQVIWGNFKRLGTPETPERTETFDEAMQRLQLTDQDIQQTSDRYLLYAIIFVVFAALAFAGGIVYLMGYGTFTAFALAMTCTAVLLVFAFRYHFWYFQIKHRKLGCTFREWWQGKPSIDKGDAP